MGKTARITIANDNLPHLKASQPEASSLSHPRVSFGTEHQPSAHIEKTASNPLEENPEPHKKTTSKSLSLTLSIWIAAICFAVCSFVFGAGTDIKALTCLSLLWTGLWSSYVNADHGHWRLSELSVITALAGLLGAITMAANYFGLGLTFADNLILMSILPLFIGLLLKSRISVLASILATLGWGALIFTSGGEISGAAALFPLILAGQVYTATHIKSGLAILLTVITAYYWGLSLILTFWTADNLPLTFAASVIFIVGMAHYRCGKASEDKLITGSAIHIYFGWTAATVGIIGFQYFLLTPEALRNTTATLSVNGLNLWKAIVITALVAIFGSAIVRYKHSQITFAGVFLLTFACAILPMMLWFPAWPQNLAAAIPGVEPLTAIGVVIGAAVTAMAIGMMLNGARRRSFTMIIMGTFALVAEGYLLLNPNLVTIDYSVIFLGALLTALAVGGLIAGASLTHQAPAPRLKHA